MLQRMLKKAAISNLNYQPIQQDHLLSWSAKSWDGFPNSLTQLWQHPLELRQRHQPTCMGTRDGGGNNRDALTAIQP
jgi:hypothetical protein